MTSVPPDRKGTAGTRNRRIQIGLLALLGGLFELILIGAAIGSVYFLYGILASDVPLHYLLWSIGTAFMVRNLAATFKSSKERVDYVTQLIERGCTRAEATSAWEIAINGGASLLRNLQQADTIGEADRQ